MSQQTFLTSTKSYAERAAAALKLPVEWVQAHWAHETGNGTNTGTTRNNLAGLYAYPGSRYGINGKAYDNLDSFTTDYIKTMSQPNFSGIHTASNVTEFATALKTGGYASDPAYTKAAIWQEVGGKATLPKNGLSSLPLYSPGQLFKPTPQTVIGSVFDNPATTKIETNSSGTTTEKAAPAITSTVLASDPNFLALLKNLSQVEKQDGLLATPKKIALMVIFASLGLIITGVGLTAFTGGVPGVAGAAVSVVTDKIKGGKS